MQDMRNENPDYQYVCVQVLRPSEPSWVMSSTTVYITILLQSMLSPLNGEPVVYTFFRQKLKNAHLESPEGRE